MPQRRNMRRREQLLDEIEAIVLVEGFRHLGVGELASRLHCSRSTLYKLAPSKTELMRTVFARFVTRAFDDCEQAAERVTAPADKIVRYVLGLSDWTAKASLEFWRDVRDFDITRGVLDAGSARGTRTVQRYMDQGIERGTLRPANSAFLAHIVWLAARAARDPDVLERVGLSPGEAMAELGRFIVYGMALPPSET